MLKQYTYLVVEIGFLSVLCALKLKSSFTLNFPALSLTRDNAEIVSGPFAFLGSRLFSNFCTPLTYNVSSLIRGAGGVRIGIGPYGILVRSSFVKILSYCLLSASAFSLPAVISLPSSLSTGIPVVSLCFVLT